tara:strand:+ start:1261 stop:1551 length:291 start_codon:yes stop_codon:yes gene_type:complete
MDIDYFRKELFIGNILKDMTIKQIDNTITEGLQLLASAQYALSEELYISEGINKETILRDIKCLEINLQTLTDAFVRKEKLKVIFHNDRPMFFHMN